MFFTAINQMMTEGVDLTIVIRKANGQMAVSTLPKCNLQIFLCLFLEKLNMPQDTPVTKAS